MAGTSDPARCKVCSRVYKVPPGSKALIPPPKKTSSDALAKRVAKLEEENKTLRAAQRSHSEVSSGTDAEHLVREIEVLKSIKGAEQCLADKQAELDALRAQKLAQKPVHIQHKELDAKLEKKRSSLRKQRSDIIPSLALKVRDAHLVAQQLEAEIKQLCSHGSAAFPGCLDCFVRQFR